MPLSSVVGAQSIVKPGVCTSSTRPASPFEGQMIYETDTDILAIWNGTAWRQLAAATKTGSVLQVVTATYSTQLISSTATYADTGLTATITPSSTSSKILVMVQQGGVLKNTSSADAACNVRLMRDATQLVAVVEIGKNGTNNYNSVGNTPITYLDNPATTSAVTYKTQYASYNGYTNGAYVQYAGNLSTVTLMEIAG